MRYIIKSRAFTYPQAKSREGSVIVAAHKTTNQVFTFNFDQIKVSLIGRLFDERW